jgi:hypothetical protein
MMRTRLTPLLLFVAVAVCIPLAARWARRAAPPRCALDGLTIDALYQVRVVDAAGQARRFCCIRCARLWLDRQDGPAQAVYVTDEATGVEIDSSAAHFVESRVVTNPVTENRVHVFRTAKDADQHVSAFAGRVLEDSARPF